MQLNDLNTDRNQDIGSGRQLPGQHDPSDIEAGRNHMLVNGQVN